MFALSFQHHFLVAMNTMDDSRFSGAVILIAEHSPKGAMGIVINKPTTQSFGLMCRRMGVDNINSDFADQVVGYGGPVNAERGLIVHQPLGQWASSFAITAGLGISHSRDIFDAIRENKTELAPQHAKMVLGCATWNAGQLEREVMENVWLTVPIHDTTPLDWIFTMPAPEIKAQTLGLLGINPASLVLTSGRA
jgi:putative transcriptional regulator